MKGKVKADNSLAQSFTCLGFAAAALIVAVQWHDATDSSMLAIPPRSVATYATTTEKLPIATLETDQAALAAISVAQGRTSSKSDRRELGQAEFGLKMALDAALQPIALSYESKLVVDLSERQVLLYQDGVVTASYPIAIGREGWETPPGNFSIINMQTDPIWQHPFTEEIIPPGADNPLGSRWIGFWTDGQQQLGFHGTNQEDLIGQAVSHGCIRLRDADIQALYNHVTLNMPVVIQP